MNPSSIVGHITELCELIDTSTQPADAVAGTFFRDRRYLGSRDRRAIGESVFGILRHRRFIETLLETYEDLFPDSRGPEASSRYLPLYVLFARTSLKTETEALQAGAGSRWQMLFPAIPFDAFLSWIDSNSDLSQFTFDPTVALGVRYSFQDWMVEDLVTEYGSEAEALLQSLNAPAPTTIRVNALKAEREDGQKRLQAEGTETEPTAFAPAGLHLKKRFDRHTSAAFKDGWFEIQDEGSQIISHFAGPRAGMFVIDACAGAGGKTLHLADLMGNTGEIFAIDSERRRLEELGVRTARAGITIVKTIPLTDVNPEGFASKAHLVLVDAPCSGSGTIRRNPSLKWTISRQSIPQFASRQLDILETNAGFVRPGGLLCYATCSIFRKENEEVVQAFLSRHPEFSLDREEVIIAGANQTITGGILRLLPHRNGTDGFFAARLRRSDQG